MSFYKYSILTLFLLVAGFLLVPFSASCSATTPRQAEKDVLEVLRQMTKDGKLPSEDVVLKIESDFSQYKNRRVSETFASADSF